MRVLFLFILIITSCSKPIKVFELNSDVEHLTIKLYADSTFQKVVGNVEEKNSFTGEWTGDLTNDSIFSTKTTRQGFTPLTQIYTHNYKIIDGNIIDIDNLLTSDFKLNFLNKILSDTIDLKIIDSKRILISDYPKMSPPILNWYTNGEELAPPIRVTHSQLISKYLKEKDTLFIQKQFRDNKKLNLSELTKYGFKMFDLKNHQKSDSLYKLIRKHYKKVGLKNYGDLFLISKPIFNKQLNSAYLRVQYGVTGYTYEIKKVNGKWEKKIELLSWIE